MPVYVYWRHTAPDLDGGDQGLYEVALLELAQEPQRAAANVLVGVNQVVAERVAGGAAKEAHEPRHNKIWSSRIL